MSERLLNIASHLRSEADTTSSSSTSLRTANPNVNAMSYDNASLRARPKFSELPLGKDDPPHSAWGLYGPRDELGALNLLTNEVVRNAAKENILTGKRIHLDLPLGFLDKPFFGRQQFEHRLKHKPPRFVNDDTWSLNTQSSTQWDGLRHFAYQKAQRFYNNTTLEDIHAPGSTVMGIQNMANRGVVGRGVLLDVHRYYEKKNIQVDHFSSHCVKLNELKEIAHEQGVEFRQGDILFTRTGFTNAVRALSEEELLKKAEYPHNSGPHEVLGVENTDEVLEWIWTTGFAAVAGDQLAFESLPPKREMWMHEVFLSGWGMPIGELFDLDELAEYCEKENRWTFFLSSEPCHVIGGVASPPNALAIM